MKISAYRNRLSVDISDHTNGVTEVRIGSNPFHWNGSAVQWEVALFDKGELVTDLSNIDQIQAELKPKGNRNDNALMYQTLASGALNGGLTQNEWDGGQEDDCHALFSFTGADANLDLQGEDAKEFRLVISAIRMDGEEITLGCVQYTVEEDGRGTAPPASVVTPIYFTGAQSDARYVMAIDLTTIENNITTLQTQMAAANASITAVTTTANNALPKSGGTMTGFLVLSGAPTSNLHAATKLYVDTQNGAFVPLAGGVMTGLLTLSGAPTSNLHAATKLYADGKLSLAGGTMTGLLTLSGAPTSNLHAATKLYVDSAVAGLVNSAPGTLDTLKELADALGDDPNFATTITNSLATKLALAGGVMTGLLTLSGAPTSNLHAATKLYVDSAVGAYVPLAGGTMTGLLTLSADPTGALQAATKQYADLKLALTGGTMTGLLQFSGTGHAGLKVNSLTSTQRDALTAANGMLIYNSTAAKFERYEGGSWRQFTSGSGAGWFSQSGTPSGGTGVDGDFDINELDGTIYKKISSAWTTIVAARMPLAGGTMTGALDFDAGLNPAISWTAEGYSLRTFTDGASSYNLEILASATPWWKFRSDGDFSVETGFLRTATGKGLKVNGTQVVTDRQAAISDVPGSPTNTQLASTLNLVLAKLRVHGLIAP